LAESIIAKKKKLQIKSNKNFANLQPCIGSCCESLLARVKINNEKSPGFLAKIEEPNMFVSNLRRKNWA
jgi:hypothetical protein